MGYWENRGIVGNACDQRVDRFDQSCASDRYHCDKTK